jgi:2,4-dienoyl-CoA reductase-like NADH-dependent reductase (Old Yellow Enzyme family)
MTDLFSPLPLASGAVLPNRFVLAPLTNTQSRSDGSLSDEEYRWLVMRAQGGFGLTMTCAASVDPSGLGFPGQLGAHSDKHAEGLKRLAAGIRAHSSFAVVQLHHAGMRSPRDLIGQTPLCPSDNAETGARAMSIDEIRRIRDRFIEAARRVEAAGFQGIEVHGAHGYLLCQFLSPEINLRSDLYGGELENRSRLIFEIIEGIRSACDRSFSVGLRLSPERFGLRLEEIRAVAARAMTEGRIDYLDLSLWDVFKEPVEDGFRGRSLASWFTELPRGEVRLGAAGKIMSADDARRTLESGFDFVVIGRAAILHHDYPQKIRANRDFTPLSLPVSADHLRSEGLGDAFVQYMRNWKGFVAEP